MCEFLNFIFAYFLFTFDVFLIKFIGSQTGSIKLATRNAQSGFYGFLWIVEECFRNCPLGICSFRIWWTLRSRERKGRINHPFKSAIKFKTERAPRGRDSAWHLHFRLKTRWLIKFTFWCNPLLGLIWEMWLECILACLFVRFNIQIDDLNLRIAMQIHFAISRVISAGKHQSLIYCEILNYYDLSVSERMMVDLL